MKKALAIDMGATSIRGIIGYIEDNEVKLEEVMRFSHEIKSSNGRLRWDFDELLEKIVSTIKENANEISSVGIDTWGVDFGIIDKEGKLIEPPVCYRDPKHQEGYEEALKVLSEKEIFAETGTQIMSINTLFQLLALRKVSPETYEKAEKLLMMPDLIQYLLTGNMSNEQLQKLKRPIYVMESGLVFTVVNMFVLGVHEIVSLIVEALDMNRNTINISELNGMSGLGHILLSVGLIWTLVKVFNIEKLIETK